jgi:Zn-dependent metalloprotease
MPGITQRLIITATAAAISATFSVTTQAAPSSDIDLPSLLTELHAANPNGSASYVDATELRGKLRSARDDLSARAIEVIQHYRARFGLDNPRKQLAVRMTRSDVAGNHHVRLGQVNRGIDVEGAELVVHFDRNGEATSITGTVVPNLDIDTTAAISARQAGISAIAAVADGSAAQPGIGDARMVVYNDGMSNGTAGVSSLAYKITVTGPGIREFVFVDATSGAILDRITGIYHTKNRSTYNMNNSIFYFNATLERVEGQGPVGDADVDNAHDYAGDTYDFYFNAYGRDSVDNAGFPLRSYTHYRNNYQNAFWDGTRMTYGDGFPVDDVTAHEITHGVTENTSNLIYSKQSGALNESVSDIFGESIDQLNGKGDDSAAVKWLIGEEIPSLGAIRDMSNPPAYGDPDRVGSPLYYCGTSDSGGVHTNSGVPNKNFYLLVEGGTFNGRTVAPLGLIKAAAIHYQAQTNYLVPSSQFKSYFGALWNSCKDLVGVNLSDPTTGLPTGQAITYDNCINVLRAGLAVEFTAPNCQ